MKRRRGRGSVEGLGLVLARRLGGVIRAGKLVQVNIDVSIVSIAAIAAIAAMRGY